MPPPPTTTTQSTTEYDNSTSTQSSDMTRTERLSDYLSMTLDPHEYDDLVMSADNSLSDVSSIDSVFEQWSVDSPDPIPSSDNDSFHGFSTPTESIDPGWERIPGMVHGSQWGRN